MAFTAEKLNLSTLSVRESPISFRVVRVAEQLQLSVSGRRYVMRGWDSGTAGWVEWGPFDSVILSPSATQTRPNFTGSLSAVHILSGP